MNNSLAINNPKDTMPISCNGSTEKRIIQALRFHFTFFILLPLFTICSQFAWADSTTKTKTQPCESDTRTLDELLKLDQPQSNKVPKDFTIEQHVERYVTVDPALAYNLPIQDTQNHKLIAFGLGSDMRDKYDCTVTGPDGVQWLAGGTNSLSLIYILKSTVLPEPVYDARSNAGNAAWKKCADEVLMKEKAGIIPYNSPTSCLEEAKKAEDKAEKELNYGNK